MASFAFDYIALAVIVPICVLVLLFTWKFNGNAPRLFFSDVKDLQKLGPLLKYWSTSPQILRNLSFILFALAFTDPHFYFEKQASETRIPPLPTEGIAIYLVLDKSGSMAEEIDARTVKGRNTRSKLDLMKEVTSKFVEERPGDMIGIVSFARQADVQVPLTIDHASVKEVLGTIQKVPNRELDGTAIGYAITKATNLITATQYYARDSMKKGRPAYEIKNGVIVLVTDGFQDPNPLDYGNPSRTVGVEEAAEYAKEQGVRLYLINVDPKLNTRQFAPHRKLMERAAELTGGRFFQATTDSALIGIYEDINALEKSKLPGFQAKPLLYERYSLYPYLIGIGMLLLFCSIFLSTTLVRRVP